MTGSGLSGVLDSKPRTFVIFAMVALSLILPHVPFLSLIALPLSSFTTIVHESSHALACILTGGHVTGMSIVSDGEGHGGLTYCIGGIPFIYAQAGYIGTALFGSLLIYLGRFPSISKYVICAIGAAFALAGIVFMSQTVLQGQIVAGLGSMLVSVGMGAFFIWVATKLNFYWANMLLMFLGVQTGLNALSGDATVFMLSLGMMPGTWSDATNMQAMTGNLVPAAVWATLWTVFAVWLMWQTLSSSYRYDQRRAIKTI